MVSSPTTLHTPWRCNESFSYSVKVINPSKKTDYSLRVSIHFATVGDTRKSLAESFSSFIAMEGELEFGYITPGHEARRRQRWISKDIDLEAMYTDYKDKREIIVWFFGNKDVIKSKKRPRSPGGGEPTKRATHQSDAHKEKMEVDQILEKLKSKHCSFSEENNERGHTLYKCKNIVRMIHRICPT